MNNATTRGFTLIELVVVIALLGILAAFAIPRFASLETEARVATVQGLSGSLRSASAMAHGLQLATGGATVDMEGNTINMTNGYPDSDSIAATLADISGFSTTPGATDVLFFRADAPGACEVRYVEAGVGGSTTPDFQVNTAGC